MSFHFGAGLSTCPSVRMCMSVCAWVTVRLPVCPRFCPCVRLSTHLCSPSPRPPHLQQWHKILLHQPLAPRRHQQLHEPGGLVVAREEDPGGHAQPDDVTPTPLPDVTMNLATVGKGRPMCAGTWILATPPANDVTSPAPGQAPCFLSRPFRRSHRPHFQPRSPTHFFHMTTNLCTDTEPVRSPPAL